MSRHDSDAARDAGDPDDVRPCPVCARPLDAILLRGVEVDACTEHGLWLDNGELERIEFQKFLDDTPKRRRMTTRMTKRAYREGLRDAFWWT